MRTTELIESFTQFAMTRVDQEGNELSIVDLFDDWRIRHPLTEDLLAIKASLRDMENGETGRSFDDFAKEFRQRNRIQETE